MNATTTNPKKRSVPVKRKTRKSTIQPISYMRDPGQEHTFTVAEKVEAYCDHEINEDRTRDWLMGTIVQIDNKMVAVQFRTNVYLTEGWMVPDRILWFTFNSEHLRQLSGKRPKIEDEIPDY
ncbi:MAG: hypothetical protein QGD88_01370 [Anaerolineae bacterium]|nr:hypothetical protein [Anaerolineae bacterium]MDK1080103.1 hypothetical protein [Anaerolineae bacterium]